VTVIATATPSTTIVDPNAAANIAAAKSVPERLGYRLVFAEEFDGKRLNTSRWQSALPWGRTNKDEYQYYSASALKQRGGQLTITASKTASHGKQYTSGAITTASSYTFKYGYTEMRAQLPAGAGLWSAFWLMTRKPGVFDEIDVVELVGSDPNKANLVLHYGTANNRGKAMGSYRGPDCSAGFHTFGVDWEPNLLVWYIDGVERYRVTQHVPKDPMFLIANLTVGGPDSWSGPPDRYTVFPGRMVIDSIRVYQR
jgi:beta-glucanase (GH16 family)